MRLGAPKNPLSFHFHFAVQPLRNHTTTKKPPPKHHTPRSACGLSFKGTSLGLRLDLTASRAGPAWGKGGSTFTGRRAVLHSFSGGGRPSRPDREKAFNTPPDRAQKKEKRASRGQSPLTVITGNSLPSAKDGRPHPRAAVSRGVFAALGRMRSTTLTAGSCEARAGWTGGNAILLNKQLFNVPTPFNHAIIVPSDRTASW